MVEKKFKTVCPGCRSANKIVSKCLICYKKVCVVCSIQGLCKDCFIKNHQSSELLIYFESKKEYLRQMESFH